VGGWLIAISDWSSFGMSPGHGRHDGTVDSNLFDQSGHSARVHKNYA
jgi:hypothetical protein